MQSAFDAHERRMWAGRSDAYRDGFAKLCAHTAGPLLDAAAVGPGRTVLDVGTGTGNVAAAAAARGAHVTAVDADPDMVEATRGRVPAGEVLPATLPVLPFADGGFDAVVGNFVVNHVAHPAAAVEELRRVARPDGRVAVTIWRDPGEAGQMLLWRAVDEAGVRRPDDLPRVDTDFPRTETGFAALLTDAGLREVTCVPVVWDHLVDAEDWWAAAAAGVATIGLTLTRQPPGVLSAVKRCYDRLADGFRTPDGLLALPHAALLAVGSR